MGINQDIDITAEQRETVLALLQRHLPNTAAWVYGSRAKWTSRPQSDLDMVVFATPEQNSRVSDLREAFEESNLPFRVNLFVWDEVPEQFREQIEAEHAVLVEREERSMGGEWRTMTLGEVVTLQRGFDLPTTERKVGSYPVIASTGPVGTHNRAIVQAPGVVIGRSGSLGGGQFIKQDFWPLNTTLWVKDFNNNDPRFCYFLLKSLDLGQFNAGSGVPTLNRNHIHPLPVRVPPLPEQRAIAHILGTLDDKIELNRRMNETLEEMARALFKSWFADFLPVRAKQRARTQTGDPVRAKAALITPPLRGSDGTVERARAYLPAARGLAQAGLAGMDPSIADLFPDRLVDSELGEIPEGWEVKSLSECIKVARGLSYKGSGLSSDGMPMHNLNSVYEGGGYKEEGIKYYNGDFQERHVTQPEDVLVANTEQGHDRLLIGFAAIIPKRFGGRSLFSHHLYRIRPERISGLSPDFVCQLLNTQAVHDNVSGYATGTTVNMLPRDALTIPGIVVPPPHLVTTFSAIAQIARSKQEQCIEESRALAAQRDELLPKLVSGELRVTRLGREERHLCP